MIEYLVIALATAALYLLCSLLFSLLFSYARVFRTTGRSRTLVGYLWKKRNGDLVLYNGLIPFLSRAKGRVLGGSEIRLEMLNETADYAERIAGYHQATRVVDEYSAEVATLTPSGNRAAVAEAGNAELAYAKGSLRAKNTFVSEAAAIGALMHNAVENARLSPDERIGIRDLMIPATLIYLLLYAALVPLAKHLTDNHYAVILLMLAAWLVIVGVLYFIKYQLHLSNRGMSWTALFNSNVGEGFLNWTLLIVSAVSLYLSAYTSILPFEYQPALMVIILSVVATMTLTPKLRQIEDPYRSCRGSWRQPPAPAPASAATMQSIQFSWVPVLEHKHITGDDKVDTFTVSFPTADYEAPSPRVREENPFFQPGLQDESQREAFTQKVLDGVDKALRDKGASDLYEDRALAAVVNSAYEVCVRYNLADFEMFDLLLLFCQLNINYKIDEECESINNIYEYYRYASETLYDRTGDCDCKAVLAYKLFELLGVDPKFVVVKANGEDKYNHAAIVLRNDPNARIPLPPQYKEYAPGKGVYCEATSDGNLHPGDMPQDIDYSSMCFFG